MTGLLFHAMKHVENPRYISNVFSS